MSHRKSDSSLTRADAASQLLCREYLQQNQLRQGLEDTAIADYLLSEEELEASLQEALASPYRDSDDVWLFAYGSLIWNPVLEYADRQVVTAHGWHRSFCMWSRVNRGTPEQPGLVLALDRGGRCTGVAYRVPAAVAVDELRLLWRREMLLGSYTPRWVHTTQGGRAFRALAFVVNRDRPGYAGRLPPERIADILSGAHGKLGSGLDYLHMTVDGLATHGIRDPALLRLAAQVRNRIAEPEEDHPRAQLQP